MEPGQGPASTPDNRGADMQDPGVSWIAQERVEPGNPSNAWIAGVIVMAAVVFLTLAVMGLGPIDRVAAEDQYREGDGFPQAIVGGLAPSMGRLLSAVMGAVAVASTSFAARRLLHSERASLLAGLLVILDPAFLVHGRLATPVAAPTALSLLALALFLSNRKAAHWYASAALAMACFVNPMHITWGVPLFIMVLARGHIYASRQHASLSGIQTLALPALGAVLGIFAADSLAAGCYLPSRTQGLFLTQTIHLGSGIHYASNPILWFSGLGALLWVAFGAVAAVFRDFRLQRLPGRIQLRVSEGLRREQGRALWLLGFVIFAPTPALWLPLFTMALASALHELGEGNRTFGTIVGIGLIALILVYTLRLWPLLVGSASDPSSLLASIPWANGVEC